MTASSRLKVAIVHRLNYKRMKTISWILKLTALTFLLSPSSGCKNFMQFKYGITQPRVVTPSELADFLRKQHFPAENQFRFIDSSSYFQEMRNPKFNKYLLGHMIFDREGTMLQRDTAQCQWAGKDKISSLRPDSVYDKCTDLHLNRILPKIQPLSGNSNPSDSLSKPDFTVLVTWGMFLGRYNYRLFDLDSAVRQNKTARIRLIWLNIDMQKSWNLRKDQRMKIK
jgi:hypothetical protein